jgi:hypothetical protein
MITSGIHHNLERLVVQLSIPKALLGVRGKGAGCLVPSAVMLPGT